MEANADKLAARLTEVSIPVRYDWKRLLFHYFYILIIVSIPVRYDWKLQIKWNQVAHIHVSIPVRYDWKQVPRPVLLLISGFNSCKVRLEVNEEFIQANPTQFQFL